MGGVKQQYLGDVNDYRKYALLRHFADVGRVRIRHRNDERDRNRLFPGNDVGRLSGARRVQLDDLLAGRDARRYAGGR